MRVTMGHMTPDVLVSGLRWTFWVLCYLFVALAGALIFLGSVPVPGPLRWAMFGTVLWAIGEDARQKLHPTPQRSHP
jgi:hypothetical protein